MLQTEKSSELFYIHLSTLSRAYCTQLNLWLSSQRQYKSYVLLVYKSWNPWNTWIELSVYNVFCRNVQKNARNCSLRFDAKCNKIFLYKQHYQSKIFHFWHFFKYFGKKHRKLITQFKYFKYFKDFKICKRVGHKTKKIIDFSSYTNLICLQEANLR